MLNRFFHKLSGTRLSLPHPMLDSYVEILSWYHALCVPAQHMALRIKNNGEEYYLSFSPDCLVGLSKRKFSELRTGVEASFLKNYEDELLIQGFRNAWPGIKDELNAEQLSFLRRGSIAKVSELEVLEITKYFSEEKKNELRKKGEPTEKIILHSLDLNKMIEKIKLFKRGPHPITWSSWAGTYFHKENTHNCASIVLDVLYEGGLANLLTSNNDLFGIAGLLLGSTYALVTQPVWYKALTEIVIAIVSSRGLGGAYEGYTGIQSFLNLNASQHKDNISAVLGLRLSTVIFSTFVGILKTGPVFPAFLTMPRDVLNLAHQAKIEEESIFSFNADGFKNQITQEIVTYIR